MNQLLIAGIGAVVIGAGGFATGWKVNSWRHDSQQLAIEQAAEKAAEKVASNAVDAIQTIEVRNVTIRQQAETITREVPVYRDRACAHDERMYQTINQALTEPQPDSGGVSTAGSAD